jgi:hypothetical protein
VIDGRMVRNEEGARRRERSIEGVVPHARPTLPPSYSGSRVSSSYRPCVDHVLTHAFMRSERRSAPGLACQARKFLRTHTSPYSVIGHITGQLANGPAGSKTSEPALSRLDFFAYKHCPARTPEPRGGCFD